MVILRKPVTMTSLLFCCSLSNFVYLLLLLLTLSYYYYFSTFSTTVVVSNVGSSILVLFSLFSHPFCMVCFLICKIVINYIGVGVLSNVFGGRTSVG